MLRFVSEARLTTDDSPHVFRWMNKPRKLSPFTAPSRNRVRTGLGNTAYDHVAEERLWVD